MPPQYKLDAQASGSRRLRNTPADAARAYQEPQRLMSAPQQSWGTLVVQ